MTTKKLLEKKNIKIVILAGGFGSRISEHTKRIPKPLIKVKNKPLILYIMDIYKKYGFNDFIIAGGYKFNILKNFFDKQKKYNVQVIDTGLSTLTGKRIKLLKKYIDTENFFLTYGDGISDVNIRKLLRFHLTHKKIATMTVVHPPSRFGELKFDKYKNIVKFDEKPQLGEGWINGGFFVFKKDFFNFLDNKNVMLERSPINKVIKVKQIKSFVHKGLWMCVDTKRDLLSLEKNINSFK